ncbi:cAMP receptor-like protein [Heterostelium album PN500]|uniref:cAMP receptor-like protein n=1 Tax=Heterostelium pallidum (strain ATCC 26659 / Pp 5 / PN500) TaxID=670386 RepID=D3AVH4_HETP5|nr:cAMP receptor-like protein [Heterostelium album PN500]EFA86297.1 cAMP receptor-like protein [Heterostelium album PN500]|eukprot:XP_020438402.1 cAMP receptor-like protein [Heterostelium album PN500]
MADQQFSDLEILQLDQISFVSVSFGCVGALFIIITYILFRDVRSFASTLIFYLSICDLMAALSYLPFGRGSKMACDIQAMGLLFFLTSSYFWTMCISISLFLVFFTNRYELGYLMKYFHYINWGIPLVLTLISLKFNIFGITGSWWKISQHANTIVSRMNVIVSFYIIAFAISQLPSIINSIQNFSSPNNPVFGLFAFQLMLQPLQVYGVNEGFVSRYIEFFEKYVCRCRKSREYKDTLLDIDRESLIITYDDDDEFDSLLNSNSSGSRRSSQSHQQLQNISEIDDFIIDDYNYNNDNI